MSEKQTKLLQGGSLLALLETSPALQERSRCLNDWSDIQGDYVLYWMHVAVRAHENPSLDVAITLANRLQKQLLVYHALSERYEFASDRHHTFILQGAADVQQQMEARGIPYVFHLERPGYTGPWLKQLSREAAVVVTDEMPVQPMRGWVDQLAKGTVSPVVAVDSSCVVPMQLVGRAYTRAFEYREATQRLYNERITTTWPNVDLNDDRFPEAELPFSPIEFSSESIPDLVAECRIDHLVGPVPETLGGSTAGYERWNDFQQHRLKTYAARRNDPLKDAASRMSAWLHYGMVSPFRIAREADQHQSAGAKKYLDELLIWRELAWAFCFFKPNHDQFSALPSWAQKTLREHKDDCRDQVYDWETLARGNTHNELWDACQQSLLVHGELHNNVRMTWGKALLHWKQSPEESLRTIIDLNHRYALDGRDPASFGGILWCLGQFDRPFKPAQPVVGTVRPRPLDQHAARLNVRKYSAHVQRSLCGDARVPKVAVIGAGIAGLTCARTLRDHGWDVQVFDKGRRPGGRMSTRQTRTGFQFDHGCQYFKATQERFLRYVQAWQQLGIVQEWTAPIVHVTNGQVRELHSKHQRFVGVPQMQSVCQHLASDLQVHCGVKISNVTFDGQWTLSDDESTWSDFDELVVAIPSQQARELLSKTKAKVPEPQPMKKSWTTILAVASPISWQHPAAVVEDEVLAWISQDSSKPGRRTDNGEQCWILQAQPDWSESQFERDSAEIANEMVSAFERIAGCVVTPNYLNAHRWKFALAEAENGRGDVCHRDSASALTVCGDWCSGSNVQSAFLSGSSAAGRLMGTLKYEKKSIGLLFE